MAEQLGFDKRFRDRGAVYGEELSGAARAQVMHRPGHQLLAGARLAGDKDRRIGMRDLVDDPEDFLDLRMFANHRRHGHRFRKLPVQQLVFPQQLHMINRPLQGQEQVFALQRLFQVIESTFFHGFDCGIDSSVGRHDEHALLRILFNHLLEKF